MTRFIFLSLSLFACNSFESQNHGKEPTLQESYIIVENNTSTDLKADTQYDRSNSILDIAELGLKVIEVTETQSAEQNTNETAEIDALIKITIPQTISTQSPLFHILTTSKEHTLVAIAGLPHNLEREDVSGTHTTSITLPNSTSLYTSDMLQSIVESVDQGASLLYIPMAQDDMTEFLFDAISYAQDNGILVFDAFGQRI